MPNDTVRAPIPHTCVNCHRALGISADPPIIPHYQDQGADGGGPETQEAWCPTCFVKVRAHQEVMPHGGPRFASDWHEDRIAQGMLRAIRCNKCGVESLAHGHLGCLQCGSQSFTVLTDAHFAAISAGASTSAARASRASLPPGPHDEIADEAKR